MLLLLSVILPGCFGLNAGLLELSVMLHSEAVLPCPHAAGNVTWSRFLPGGEPVILVSIINNQQAGGGDKRYRSQGDNALVISRVETTDERLYQCNGKNAVYLTVTSDLPKPPTPAAPTGGWSVTVRPDQQGAAESQSPSDWWKIPVGAVAGASLMLLFFFVLRRCSAETDEKVGETLTEVVYEEIRDIQEQPESPYYSIVRGDSGVSNAEPNLYSSVRKMKTETSDHPITVYHVLQLPLQTEC